MRNVLRTIVYLSIAFYVSGCSTNTINTDGVTYKESGEIVSLDNMFKNGGVYICYERDRKKRFVLDTNTVNILEKSDGGVVSFEIPTENEKTALYDSHQFRKFWGALPTISCKLAAAQ